MANILILTSIFKDIFQVQQYVVYKIVAHKLTKNLSQASFYFYLEHFLIQKCNDYCI